MNSIQYSPVSCKGLDQIKPAVAKQTTDNQTESTILNGETQLPGYNLSFGMAKIVRNPNATNLQYKDKEFINDCFEKNELERWGSYTNEQKSAANYAIGTIFFNFSDNNKAIEYTIGKIIDRDSCQREALFDAYLDTVQSKFKERDPKKAVKLTKLAFDTKDASGKTFLDYALAECKKVENGTTKGKVTLAHLLNKTKDYPDIQYKILMTKDNDENSFIHTTNDSHTSSGIFYNIGAIFNEDNEKTINDHIYELTAETEDISVEDSIALLEEYGSILDDRNKETLEILTSGSSDDYTIIDRAEIPVQGKDETDAEYIGLPGGVKELPGGEGLYLPDGYSYPAE